MSGNQQAHWEVFSVYAQHEIRTPSGSLVAVAQSLEYAKQIAFAAARIQSLEAELAAVRAQMVPLTERQIVECIAKAGCIGTVKLTFDSGPYEVTRTTVNADKLAKAIEAAHGITPPAPTQTQPAQEPAP